MVGNGLLFHQSSVEWLHRVGYWPRFLCNTKVGSILTALNTLKPNFLTTISNAFSSMKIYNDCPYGDVMTWNNCECSMWWRHHGKSQIDALSLVMHLSQAIIWTNAALSSSRTQNDIQSKSCQKLDLYNVENALYIAICCVAVLSVGHPGKTLTHYNDVILSAMESQITSLTIVHSSFYSGANQRKHQSSASLAFVTGEFPAQRASNAEMFPFDDVIMI